MGEASVFKEISYIERLKGAGFTKDQILAQAELYLELLEKTMATKEELAKLETKIEVSKTGVIKWVTGLLLGQVAVIATLVKLL